MANETVKKHVYIFGKQNANDTHSIPVDILAALAAVGRKVNEGNVQIGSLENITTNFHTPFLFQHSFNVIKPL